MSRACARAMTSQGPARLAVSETPGKSRSAAATMAAWPAWVWIKMYAGLLVLTCGFGV